MTSSSLPPNLPPEGYVSLQHSTSVGSFLEATVRSGNSHAPWLDVMVDHGPPERRLQTAQFVFTLHDITQQPAPLPPR